MQPMPRGGWAEIPCPPPWGGKRGERVRTWGAGDLPRGAWILGRQRLQRQISLVPIIPRTSPAPHTLPRADPLCLSILALASQRCPTTDLPGAGSGLGAPSLQVFLGCWDCATREPWTPPGVNVQPRRPLPGHRCVIGWVWMPAACPSSWGSRTCPPCTVLAAPSSQVLGGWWLSPLSHPGCRLDSSGEPRGQGLPLFWHHPGKSCRVAFCNTTIAMVVATANTCVVG